MLKSIRKECQQILEHYSSAAEMLGEMFSPFIEVIVPDLRESNRSTIKNNEWAYNWRQIGDSIINIGYRRSKEDSSGWIFNCPNKSFKVLN